MHGKMMQFHYCPRNGNFVLFLFLIFYKDKDKDKDKDKNKKKRKTNVTEIYQQQFWEGISFYANKSGDRFKIFLQKFLRFNVLI